MVKLSQCLCAHCVLVLCCLTAAIGCCRHSTHCSAAVAVRAGGNNPTLAEQRKLSELVLVTLSSQHHQPDLCYHHHLAQMSLMSPPPLPGSESRLPPPGV